MKYLITSAFGLIATLNCMTGFCGNTDGKITDDVTRGNVDIFAAPGLKDLANTWIMEYTRVDPDTRICLQDMTADQPANTSMCLVTADMADAMGEDVWKICLGHQPIVAVVSARNPLAGLFEKGMKPEDFAAVFSAKPGQLLHPFLVDNADILSAVAAFTRIDPSAIRAELVSGTQDLITTLEKDDLAIGFCFLSDITTEGQTGLAPNLRLAPIDKNSNGRLDSFENIYDNTSVLSRGIWIGKYPHELSGQMYAAATKAPTDAKALAFLTWITGNGGKFLSNKGYTSLTRAETEYNLTTLASLAETVPVGVEVSNRMWLYIITVLLVVAILSVLVLTFFRRTPTASDIQSLRSASVFNAGTPHGYYFDKSHTWAYMEKNGNIRMGIDDFLQHVTGSISRILLKENGTEIRRGEKILTLVKDGKQLNIYAPVTGIIKSRNNHLQKNASVVNADPYASGWIYEIEPKNWLREIQFMFMGESYFEWMKEEFGRLRRFFESALQPKNPEPNYAILQDGGELKDHVLADLGPEIWEEFQSKFIDKSR